MSHPAKKNALEWTVFAISSCLVLATAGLLVRQMLETSTQRPPAIEIELGKAQQAQGHYMLPVRATNRGDETAEDVVVQVTLTTPSGELERSYFEIRYLPKNANRDGWVVFETDPAQATLLDARPLGFALP